LRIPQRLESGKVLLAHTETAWVVGPQASIDGPISLLLTDEPSCPELEGMRLFFSGVLLTPSRELHVFDCSNQSLACLPVKGPSTRIDLYAGWDADTLKRFGGDIQEQPSAIGLVVKSSPEGGIGLFARLTSALRMR
jgi:hypothetical protein